MLSTEAGCASILFSETRAACVYWATMRPELRPASRVRNAGNPRLRAGFSRRLVRRSLMLANSDSALSGVPAQIVDAFIEGFETGAECFHGHGGCQVGGTKERACVREDESGYAGHDGGAVDEGQTFLGFQDDRLGSDGIEDCLTLEDFAVYGCRSPGNQHECQRGKRSQVARGAQ